MLARRREIIREAGLEESGVVDAWQKSLLLLRSERAGC